ncbi:MAG: hypothetical protein KDK99_03020, partial [Verrucomicrobiales bacterium]|nr:hypothetical protein [Verrucomicrobiales bacterium]
VTARLYSPAPPRTVNARLYSSAPPGRSMPASTAPPPRRSMPASTAPPPRAVDARLYSLPIR